LGEAGGGGLGAKGKKHEAGSRGQGAKPKGRGQGAGGKILCRGWKKLSS